MNVSKEEGKSGKSERAYEKKCFCESQHNRSKPIRRHPFSIALFGHICAKDSSPRGKNGARSTDFFQSRNFCAALKNKVQIFACRFFSAFLISRRWQRARESSCVNKV